jgi:prepilin-type N-terminal cleavage/methylation domain-containing protein
MRNRGEQGFTLIELSIAMGTFLLFMAFATPFMFGQIKQALQSENQIDLQQSSRTAFRTLVRELRQARDLYASTDKPSGKNKLSFGSDLDASGGLSAAEQLTYYVKSAKLYREAEADETEKGQPIATDVKSIEFTMWGTNPALDDNGDGLVDESELDTDGNGQWSAPELTQVQRITVKLTLAAQADEFAFTEQVWLRNKAV